MPSDREGNTMVAGSANGGGMWGSPNQQSKHHPTKGTSKRRLPFALKGK